MHMLVDLPVTDMNIQKPNDEDTYRLKKLWCECFPGDEKFRDFFFDNYYCKDKCAVAKNDSGEIMCATYYLCGRIVKSDGYEPVVYYYACGTKPELRKLGLFRKFNTLLRSEMVRRGFTVAALTADDGLEDMYDRMGYTRCSTLRITTINEISNYECAGINIDVCSLDNFIRLRNYNLSHVEHALLWDDDVMEFLYKDYMEMGCVFSISVKSMNYYAVVTNEPDILFIHETSIPSEYISEYADLLRNYYNTDKAIQIYSRHEIIFEPYYSEIKYYGHGMLAKDEINVKLLNDIYINLIEE